jgi:hypothetical protein
VRFALSLIALRNTLRLYSINSLATLQRLASLKPIAFILWGVGLALCGVCWYSLKLYVFQVLKPLYDILAVALVLCTSQPQIRGYKRLFWLVLTCLTACVNGWRLLDGLRQQKGLKKCYFKLSKS